MATTFATAKNGVAIFRVPSYSTYNIIVTTRGGSYRFNDASDYVEQTIQRGATYLADNGEGSGWSGNPSGFYLRVTAQDSSLKMEAFTSLPPTTGGTPDKGTLSATDSTYLISGTWAYTLTGSATFVSFTSLDASTYSVAYNANGGTGTPPATQSGAASYTVAASTPTYVIEEQDSRLVYNPAWTLYNEASVSNGYTKYGAGTITGTFDGTQVELIGYRAPSSWGYGTGTVSIDGGTPTAVTWVNEGGRITGQSIYKSPVLASGTHTILITAGTTLGTIDYLQITTQTITRAGYTFAGWNTASDGTGTNYAAGAAITPAANVTLYAQWTLSIVFIPKQHIALGSF